MDPTQQNPYAAPQARTELAPGGGGGGAPQPWDIGEVFSAAWQAFTANWGVLVGSVVLAIVAVYAVEIAFILVGGPSMKLTHYTPGEGLPAGFIGFELALVAVVYLLDSFLFVGLARVWMSAARGGHPTIGLFFSGGGRLVTMLLCMLATAIAIDLGFVLLIVPGVILGLGLSMSYFFVADGEVGPIQAMQASWQATKGQKGALFLFFLVLLLLNFGGALACGVGLLVTAPLSGVALAIVFARITGRVSERAEGGELPGLATT